MTKIQRIEEFLLRYEPLWQNEPLTYLRPYSDEVDTLISSLQPASIESKLSLVNHQKSPKFSSSLNELIINTRQLSTLPQFQSSTNLPNHKFKKLSAKKAHEIGCIINFLRNKQFSKRTYLDCAGGKGHLSFHITEEFQGASTCIDKDEQLLKEGKKLFQNTSKIHFQQSDIYQIAQEKISAKEHIFSLHCCGDLTDYILKYFKSTTHSQSYLGFGCCYHKIPSKTKIGNITLSNEAKTLAMRSHRPHCLEDLNKRIQVKKFRYPFEIYLKENDLINAPLNLRSSRSEVYQKDYRHYIQSQNKKLNLNLDLNNMIEHFLKESTQEKVQYLINAGLLRGIFGRMIEVYINLNRAIKYSEQEDDLEVVEVFNRERSQRNIGIYIKKGEKLPSSLD